MCVAIFIHPFQCINLMASHRETFLIPTTILFILSQIQSLQFHVTASDSEGQVDIHIVRKESLLRGIY